MEKAQIRPIIGVRGRELIEELGCINHGRIATGTSDQGYELSLAGKQDRLPYIHSIPLEACQQEWHARLPFPGHNKKWGIQEYRTLTSRSPTTNPQFHQLRHKVCSHRLLLLSISAFGSRPSSGIVRKFILLPSRSPSQCPFRNSHNKSCNCLGSGLSKLVVIAAKDLQHPNPFLNHA